MVVALTLAPIELRRLCDQDSSRSAQKNRRNTQDSDAANRHAARATAAATKNQHHAWRHPHEGYVHPTLPIGRSSKPVRLVPLKKTVMSRHGPLDQNQVAPTVIPQAILKANKSDYRHPQASDDVVICQKPDLAPRSVKPVATLDPAVPPDMIEQFRAEYRSDYSRLAQVEAQREAQRAAKEQADREVYTQQVAKRRPMWWPGDLKLAPPKRRPPDPRTIAAAEARLCQIHAKRNEGLPLSVAEESDADAIGKLKQLWAEDSAMRAVNINSMDDKELNLPTRPILGPKGLALPSIPRHRTDAYDAATCMIWT